MTTETVVHEGQNFRALIHQSDELVVEYDEDGFRVDGDDTVSVEFELGIVEMLDRVWVPTQPNPLLGVLAAYIRTFEPKSVEVWITKPKPLDFDQDVAYGG